MNWNLLSMVASLAAVAAFAIPATARDVTFTKTVVDPLFRSEGVGAADINKDGKNDIVVGDLWYEAPEWKPHEIRKPRKPVRGGYTEAFAVYPDDYNRDGWVDVMVIPFHGKDAKWYENPQNKEGHWKERVAFKGTGNETRLYIDLFGDGKRVFLMGVEGQLAWVPVPEDPNGAWPVHAISEKSSKGPAHKFAHGLGAGDVNGDGRNDVLYKDGWFEQPAGAKEGGELWKFHKNKIAGDNIADMYVLDADGDKRNDVFCTSAHGHGFYFCRQAGAQDAPTFESQTLNKLIYETHSLNYDDINGDGRKDLITGRRFCAHGYNPSRDREPSELYWFELKTSAGATPEVVPHKIDDQSGVGAQFVTTDFNGDGRMDIVVSNRKGVFLFLQDKE